MRIKYLVMDVDGTLTDGRIYMGENGEIMKAFSIKDGCGINILLPKAGITPIIITSRSSRILENRCKEINIRYLFQGVSDKISVLQRFLQEQGGSFSEVAFIGDDLNDITCMKLVKQGGGLVGVPADGCRIAKEFADFVSDVNGGAGAVRDFIEWLIN